MTTTTTTITWHSLPVEMKLAVVDLLDPRDLKALSLVDSLTYNACVPALFANVHLKNFDAVERFLDTVPRCYWRHIQCLDLSTLVQDVEDSYYFDPYYSPPESQNPGLAAQTEALISLLICCSRLQKLALRMPGSMDKAIITAFPLLSNLKELAISNCCNEEERPVSERLVVHIAASIPNLQVLHLDHISRSTLHASDLLAHSWSHVPLVTNDSDIPDHPVLGSKLNLPSLLRIPTLRKLTIRDTHLGDPEWATTPVACKLETLDLGSCYHESERFNSVCTERIMAAVGSTVDEFSLTAAVSDAALFAKPSVTPLPRLRKLHIAPFFPVESVVDTMSNLAGSPIESLSLQCYEDDVVDMCSALEEFLSLRVERGPEFYKQLKKIDVCITSMPSDEFPSALSASPLSSSTSLFSIPASPALSDASSASQVEGESLSSSWIAEEEQDDEKVQATKRLQEFCRDLSLSSSVVDLKKAAAAAAALAATATATAAIVDGIPCGGLSSSSSLSLPSLVAGVVGITAPTVPTLNRSTTTTTTTTTSTSVVVCDEEGGSAECFVDGRRVSVGLCRRQ
ncbi:hypothetical protein AMATHDRAFT_71954 [Amanita thiersii Skay4041]|uniref:F-box domain-containing protein n=1 Tax=Amanita thiersii Skay4041 TaxID=703135 RepID=A0A2A9N735_9AGAR|nr:hypothetical protein AMATHDRAFT_71954 [Amanita thiersii Skay4041]